MIDIPPNIQNHKDDFVSYQTNSLNSSIQTYENSACYASHINKLQSCEFTCYPNKRSSILPYEVFYRWITLCQENGFVPKEATINKVDDNNILIIPNNNYDNNIVYAALCCYRWSENQAPMPYCVVKLLEKTPKMSFFQAFHYACCKYISLVNHSFCNLSILGSCSSFYGNYGKSGQFFLPWGLAVRIFFTKSRTDKSKTNSFNSPHTTDGITTVVENLGFVEPHKNTIKNWLGNLCVRNVEDLLWDEWNDLYHMEDYTKQNINDYYKTVMTSK